MERFEEKEKKPLCLKIKFFPAPVLSEPALHAITTRAGTYHLLSSLASTTSEPRERVTAEARPLCLTWRRVDATSERAFAIRDVDVSTDDAESRRACAEEDEDGAACREARLRSSIFLRERKEERR